MVNKEFSREIVEDIPVTLEGALLSDQGNIVEYKVLFEVLTGTASSIERFTKLLDQSGDIRFFLKPPEKGSFEIIIHAVQWVVDATISLLPQANTINDAVGNFLEFLKIKNALKGEKLIKENIITNEAGDINIKNNSGEIVYNDNKKITNINVIINASNDLPLNKAVSKIAEALEGSTHADSLTLGDPLKESFKITRELIENFKYVEHIEEKPDSVVGYIRSINNVTNRGTITVLEEDKPRALDFEIGTVEIDKINQFVRDLAIAEGYKARVRLVGERVQDETGKTKKIVVNSIEVLDQRLDI